MTTVTAPRLVALRDLVRDPRLQARAGGLVEETVVAYAEVLAAGRTLPAPEVVEVGEELLLVDGWHRVEAARRLGHEKIAVVVEVGGTFERAAQRAAGANSTHGLPRTPADKRRAVRLLLDLDGWERRSDRAIAEAAKVGHDLVAAVRREVLQERAQRGAVVKDAPRVGLDGKTYAARAPRPTAASADGPPADVADVAEAVDAALSRCQRCGNSGTLRDLDPRSAALCRSCSLAAYEERRYPSPTPPASETPAPAQQQPAYLPTGDAPQHWDTPAEIVAAVHRVAAALGVPVALDPCASPTSTLGATRSLRVEDGRDGLAEDWARLAEGGLVYVNPPWGDLGPWIERALRVAGSGAPVLLLLPYRCYREDVAALSSRPEALLRVDVATRVRFLLRGAEDPGGCPFPVSIWLLDETGVEQYRLDEAREALSALGPVLDLSAQRDSERDWSRRRREAQRAREADEKQRPLPLAAPPKKDPPTAAAAARPQFEALCALPIAELRARYKTETGRPAARLTRDALIRRLAIAYQECEATP